MNIFGLFFSFFVPGVLVGLMLAAAIRQRKTPAPAGKRRALYVEDLREGR